VSPLIAHLKSRRVLHRRSCAPSPTAATIDKNVKEEEKSRITRYYNDHTNVSFMTCVRDSIVTCYMAAILST